MKLLVKMMNLEIIRYAIVFLHSVTLKIAFKVRAIRARNKPKNFNNGKRKMTTWFKNRPNVAKYRTLLMVVPSTLSDQIHP